MTETTLCPLRDPNVQVFATFKPSAHDCAFSAIKTIVTPIASVLAGAFRLGVGIAASIIGGLVAIVARVASTILSIWSSVIGTAGQIHLGW